MLRTFETHKIRKTRELTGHLWEFTAVSGAQAGKTIPAAVPSCWESYPGYERYRGEGIYRTKFTAGGNLRLEFKGVSHTATVLLDGKELCTHYNAYTSFDGIVLNAEPGEHVLEVRADNRFSQHSALHVPNDYMSYGGISRPVALEELKHLYIEWIHVTPQWKNGLWSARMEIKVTSLSDKEEWFDLSINAAGQAATIPGARVGGGESVILTTAMDFSHVHPWNVGQPNLYYVQAVLRQAGTDLDDLIDRFGFREVTVDGSSIRINGRKVRFKGVCRHEDHPQFCCALPFAAMQYDLDIIKHMGANSVRTAHYPNDELFLDLCDEQGILVWEENHARGLSAEQMRNPNFEPQAENVIREMIRSHYNHPSIYIWGILNECASDDPYGKQCYEQQFRLIRSLDTSRPTSFASCKFKTDICFDLPEVVSYNIYPLWYHDTPVEEYLRDLYEWIQQETPGRGKPFLITEVGAGGIYGYRNAYDAKWTEDYQAEALKQQLTAILGFDPCQGVYIWQYCDIRISEEWWGGRPRTMNNKGIVDEFRRRKLAFSVVKDIFSQYPDFYD